MRDEGADGSLSHSLTLSLQRIKEQKLQIEGRQVGGLLFPKTLRRCPQIHVSDTSRDGLSLEFIAATSGRECYIQDARGRGL